jgi:diphthine synthase
MLIFIGLGLHDEKDITLRGLEEARSCDVLFAEFYTSHMAGTNVEKIQSLIGKEIRLLSREEIEEEGDRIIEEAKNKKVGLLVAGDPLISTTHVHLRIQAKKMKVPTKVVHNASICSAAPSISGLQNYKFGRSTSIAIPEKGFFPEMPYDVLKENLSRGLHTLFFLDIKEIPMSANEAIKVMLKIEEKRREGIFTSETRCVVLGNVGSEDCIIRSGKAKELLKMDFGPLPHTLIVPSKLHFMEEEYLEEFG